jgi:glycosyltransferase involved in cell wall biosynthesis
MVEVSVVIPTKNEEQAVGCCLEKVLKSFDEHNIDGEVILADNSTDRTPEIAQNMGARVITPDRLGYGYAYKYGFAQARGNYIVMGDADNTYDFEDIPRLLAPLRDGTADMVMGSRLKGKILPGSMPTLHKYIGNPILTAFLNFFFKASVSDSHSGFRAFTKEAYEKMHLRSTGMEFASEMIIEAARRGIRIKEIPIIYHPRIGESKLSSFSDGWRHLKFMLLYTPKHLFIIPGMILFALGLFLMAVTALGTNIGYHPSVHTMIFGSLFLIGGYEIATLGLFAGVYGRTKDIIDLDEVTEWIVHNISLERGIEIGLVAFCTGFVYSLWRVITWVMNGFPSFPWLEQNLIAFTLIIVGLQTVFSSFFLNLIGSDYVGGTPSPVRYVTDAPSGIESPVDRK